MKKKTLENETPKEGNKGTKGKKHAHEQCYFKWF